MEMFFLNYVNETMYLLGDLPFFKTQVNGFMVEMTPLVVREEPGATLSALRPFVYL